MKKISIIIPVYNVEDYFQECLESVLAQSYHNLEVICVDDCGTDNSMSIAEDFVRKDGRIRIIHHEKNKGLGPARNTGIDEAHGEYIFFLDADDMLYPNTLEQLIDNAQKTNADVVAGRVIAFPHVDDEKLKNFAESYNRYDSQAISGVYQLRVGDFSSSCFNLSRVSHGRLFLNSFLKNSKLRFIDDKIAHEDEGFFCKYMSCFPLVSITDIESIKYRIRPGSIMTGLDSKSFYKRREHHMKLVLADAYSYICTQNRGKDVDQILYTLGRLVPHPFLVDYGPLLSVQWGTYEKLVRFLGISLYRERLNSKGYKVYRILGLPVWKDKSPLGQILP